MLPFLVAIPSRGDHVWHLLFLAGVREWGERVFFLGFTGLVLLVTHKHIASLSPHTGLAWDSVAERLHHCLTRLAVNL